MPFPTGIQSIQHVADPTKVPKSGVALGEPSLATNATTGFPHIPTMAGAPSGTPTLVTGFAPLVLDVTNGRLYAFYAAAWHLVALT